MTNRAGGTSPQAVPASDSQYVWTRSDSHEDAGPMTSSEFAPESPSLDEPWARRQLVHRTEPSASSSHREGKYRPVRIVGNRLDVVVAVNERPLDKKARLLDGVEGLVRRREVRVERRIALRYDSLAVVFSNGSPHGGRFPENRLEERDVRSGPETGQAGASVAATTDRLPILDENALTDHEQSTDTGDQRRDGDQRKAGRPAGGCQMMGGQRAGDLNDPRRCDRCRAGHLWRIATRSVSSSPTQMTGRRTALKRGDLWAEGADPSLESAICRTKHNRRARRPGQAVLCR
jgi:hypothetical protein